MEQTFPGIQVYIAHKESVAHLFKNSDQCLTREQLFNSKNQFAYIRELTCDMKSQPVEEFMKESNIPCGPLLIKPNQAKRCVILTKGILPTRNLTDTQIQAAKTYAQKKGYQPELDAVIDPETLVIGVENEQFYAAALMGCPVTLIPTGIGENLFKTMFPHGEIL